MGQKIRCSAEAELFRGSLAKANDKNAQKGYAMCAGLKLPAATQAPWPPGGDFGSTRAEGRKTMTAEMIVRHCAPTLAGINTGSMFTCPCASRQMLTDELRQLNRRLVPRGLCVLPLRYLNRNALIYVFRPNALRRDLSDQAAAALLQRHGYRNGPAERCICHLIGRFQAGGEFPHEVGLFLGYPPEDVRGFIDNRAAGHKMTGRWKVYGDEAAARKTFDRYKRCTQAYCLQWKKGTPIERLTVAG